MPRLNVRKILPKQIKVKKRIYTISFRKMKIFGYCSDDGKIVLRAGLNGKLLISTLIHEVLHAIEFEYQIKLKHEDVYTLETGLTALLASNFLCPKSLILRSK